MTFIESIKAKAKQSIKNIILPEGSDIRTLQAASTVLKEGYANITILGNEEKIKEMAKENNLNIEKATINYNPMGVREIYVAVYAIRHSKDFGAFWNTIVECAKEYKAPHNEYEIVWDEEEEETNLSGVRSYHGVYEMDGLSHDLHIMGVKIQE